MDVQREIAAAIKNAVTLLTNGDFEKLAAGSRLTPSELKDAVEQYPGTLTGPADAAHENFDIYKVNGEDKWITESCLWVDGERSDLLLKMVCTLKKDGLGCAVWDLYVP